MNRRTFIKIFTSILGFALITSFVVPWFNYAIQLILKRDTKQLSLQPNAIEQFIRDAKAEQFWNKYEGVKKILLVAHTYLGFMSNLLPYRNKYVQYRAQITGHFLLSTDFFLQKMRTDRAITYKQFYNPYKQACSNPFSTTFYPEKA